jgi:hypothetical protein
MKKFSHLGLATGSVLGVALWLTARPESLRQPATSAVVRSGR